MANYIEKGKSLLENKEYTKAIEFFQASIESLESVKEAYLGLAEAYLAINKDEQGKVALFKAMALEPNNSQGISMIQKYCLPSWLGNGTPCSVVQNTQQNQEDPVINILPHKSLGNNYYVAVQRSGNRLFFKVGTYGCTVVRPTDHDGWNGYEKPQGDVFIPEKLNVNNKILNVIAIEELVFYQNKTITSVYLPDTIQRIKSCAFWGATLSNIVLPSALQHIEDRAFSKTLLEEIYIPDSCKTIGYCSFSKCHNLSDIHLNNGLLKIGDYAFEGCDIHKIDIPESVTEIGLEAFPLGTIIRLHGDPPKISFADRNRYVVYVSSSKEYLYKHYWWYNKVNTY